MAKIKIKFGENEIEIDSRDFYVDNQTLDQVIKSIITHIEENRIILKQEKSVPLQPEIENETYQEGLNYLQTLENAEVHEPEYTEPIPIFEEEIKEKIKILEKNSFFEKPRTASETVSQLREYGWAAGPLQVSKVLAKMALNKELLKNSQENRSYYITKTAMLTN